MRRTLRIVHVGLVLVITTAVLVQAALAGQFVSDLSNALPIHGAVGGMLELLGLLLLIVAIAHRFAGERTRAVLAGSIVLAVALEAQAALGWAPGALPTAIHVPLGVAIFAIAVGLSTVMVRMVTAAQPADDGSADRTVAKAGPGGARP
jgi:hypothetical protein